jgi:hypothetical protein
VKPKYPRSTQQTDRQHRAAQAEPRVAEAAVARAAAEQQARASAEARSALEQAYSAVEREEDGRLAESATTVLDLGRRADWQKGAEWRIEQCRTAEQRDASRLADAASTERGAREHAAKTVAEASAVNRHRRAWAAAVRRSDEGAEDAESQDTWESGKRGRP